MAVVAFCLATEKSVAAFGGVRIERARRWLRRRNGEFVLLESRKFRGDPVTIRIDVHIAEAILRCDRELRRIVQSWIEEPPYPMHLQNGYKGVPVRHRSPTRPSVQIDPPQSKSRRYQGSRRFSVRSKGFAVQRQLCVKLARPPTQQHRSHRRLIDT